MRYCSALVAIITLTTQPVPSWAELISNGSFETPIVSISDPLYAGDPRLAGWTIQGNSIDVASEAFFQRAPLNPTNSAAGGLQMVDLDGTPGPGSISQTVPTVAGCLYELSFAYSRNIWYPDLYAADPSLALASATGSTPLAQLAIQSSLAGPSLVWTSAAVLFVANSSETTITFASNDGAGHLGGILIDAVSLLEAQSTAISNSTWGTVKALFQ